MPDDRVGSHMARSSGIYYVPCPECDAAVKMGLPRSAGIEDVTRLHAGDSPAPCDGDRRKSRTTRCREGHPFRVCFEF